MTPAAIATKPSSASRPSRNEYAGSRAAFRRITERLRVDSTPVTECGYMNRARAEPSAREAYAHWATPGGMVPLGAASPAAIASAFSVLKVANESLAVAKMWLQPPTWDGM